MSICAIIANPVSEDERLFNVPVATELIFKQDWLPAVRELELRWVPAFSTGIELLKEDLPAVLDELTRLKEWAGSRLSGRPREQMMDRITRLETDIPNAFSRDGIIVFVG